MPALTDPPAVPPGLPPGCVVVSAGAAGVRTMSAAAVADAVRVAYESLRRRTNELGRPHWLRVWNFVPGLLDRFEDGPNRYMAFNAGRHAAMSAWFGERLAGCVPAGTGVGCAGDDLIVHVLAAAEPGAAVQNPNQTPATCYSAKYGPKPPCFARATRVGGVLLVSGTAAIAGEDTVAPDSLPGQFDLTLSHLAALGGGLDRYRSLRAYVPRAVDVAFVRARLASAAPRATADCFVTDLCRPELRVEIEGVAGAGHD